jgi:hypothetical protein
MRGCADSLTAASDVCPCAAALWDTIETDHARMLNRIASRSILLINGDPLRGGQFESETTLLSTTVGPGNLDGMVKFGISSILSALEAIALSGRTSISIRESYSEGLPYLVIVLSNVCENSVPSTEYLFLLLIQRFSPIDALAHARACAQANRGKLPLLRCRWQIPSNDRSLNGWICENCGHTVFPRRPGLSTVPAPGV